MEVGMVNKVSVVIEHDESGYFTYSPELPGCYSQGDTYEEALSNIKEAIRYLKRKRRE
jgi:predicted RNase H-like HicB family nuclease